MHATKTLGCGEGGFVFSNDEEWFSRFRAWINFGFWASRESSIVGLNAKLSEYHAAVALAALDRWPETRELYRAVGRTAVEISSAAGLKVHPALQSGYATPYWIVECADRAQRDRVQEACAQSDIATRRWWSHGAHAMPAYSAVPCEPLDVTEHLADVTLGLLHYADIHSTELNQIAEVVTSTANSPRP